VPEQLRQLGGRVHVAETAAALHEALGTALQRAAADAVARRQVFHLALSGGSTPEPFYRMLASEERWARLPWAATHVWLVDERLVSGDDPRSNFGMIDAALRGLPASNRPHLHPVAVSAADPATWYECEFLEIAGEVARLTGAHTVPRLDFVLLGMGADGHTASLFPNSPALAERQHLFARNDGPTVTPPPRLTMTYLLLNAAREIAILCTGRGKAATLRAVATQLREEGSDPTNLPITGIRPASGALTWYLDRDATSVPE
jgi:6-phosphogluconolactonase